MLTCMVRDDPELKHSDQPSHSLCVCVCVCVCVSVCVCVCLCVCVCVCVCDEWASARRRSLGGLGSICLSVSCQHCQWLTTSSTHSTSLFITTHVTHMRVHVQSSEHAYTCTQACAQTHKRHPFSLWWTSTSGTVWSWMAVRWERGGEMFGCSINTEPHMQLRPLNVFCIFLCVFRSLLCSLAFPLSSSVSCTLCVCVSVCVRHWPSLSSGQSDRTRFPQRCTVGGERWLLGGNRGGTLTQQDICVFLEMCHKTGTIPEVEKYWNRFH